mgnify:CR=1 FL=1
MEEISSKRVKQALKVAHYYYQGNMDQSKIAQEMGLSRPTVSRLLQLARDNGYVKIEIKDPFEDVYYLEQQLEKKYQLQRAIVVYAPSSDYQTIIQKIGQATADYLQKIVTDDDIIGVTWGKTLREIAISLNPDTNHQQNVRIVQLKGGVTHSMTDNFASEVMRDFTQAFHAKSDSLPLPVIFDNAKTKELVTEDRHIQYVIQQGQKANIAVFTVGTVYDDAMLFKLDYLDEKEIMKLKKESVGDISSRFIKADGEIADEGNNRRTIGIELDDLRQKKHAFFVDGGARKLAAIRGALVGQYANTLVIDEGTARLLLAE